MTWLVLTSNQRSVDSAIVTIGTFAQATLKAEVAQLKIQADAHLTRLQSAVESRRFLDGSEEDLYEFFISERDAGFHAAISGLFLATSNGNLFGLQADPSTWPLDRWRFTLASRRTSRRLVHYDVQSDGKRGGVLRRLGRYDTQPTSWYQSAMAQRDTAVWSAKDRSGGRGPKGLFRSRAIEDSSGNVVAVIGVEFDSRHLQAMMQALPLSENSVGLVLENNQVILAARIPGGDSGTGYPDRSLIKSGKPLLEYVQSEPGRTAWASSNSVSEHRMIEIADETGHLMVMPIGQSVELDWTLVLFVPAKDYLGSMASRLSKLLPLVILVLALAVGSVLLFRRCFSRPLVQLRDAAARIAVGQFDVPLNTHGENEIGQLARAVDGMRFRLRDSFDELLKQTRRAEVTLDSIADGVISVTADGCVRYMNVQAETLTGQSFRSVRGMPVEQVFKARDERTGEPLTRRAILREVGEGSPLGKQVIVSDTVGSRHFVHCRVSPIRADGGTMNEGAVLIFSDLSQELRLRSELVHQASHDTLTDLVNRREFERRILRAIENTGVDRGDTHVLCYIDVDQFKVINDTCGHVAGDELLRQLARHFEQKLRPGDTVSRLGGDEFGILLEQCSLNEAQQVVGAIRDSIAEFRFFWDDRSFSVGLSAGIVVIDQTTVSVMAALRDADSACYVAKEGGRNRVHVHSDHDEQLALRRGQMQWIDRIEMALAEDQFELHAQSIVPTSADVVAAGHFEVLLRLKDADGRLISPVKFLPAAEHYGLASRIDRWVVSHTLDWLAAYQDSLDQIRVCAINLSGQSLGDADFLPFLLDTIRASNVPPELLCFEVTETATIENMGSARKLISTLRAEGCSFALDDFGSGMSSFAYLKNLEVDYLKIDGQFVREMQDNPLDLAMVRSINEIGQTMGMRTIAEFVENDQIRKQLEAIGVDFVQGYGIDKPMALSTWLSVLIAESLDLSLGNGTWH